MTSTIYELRSVITVSYEVLNMGKRDPETSLMVIDGIGSVSLVSRGGIGPEATAFQLPGERARVGTPLERPAATSGTNTPSLLLARDGLTWLFSPGSLVADSPNEQKQTWIWACLG